MIGTGSPSKDCGGFTTDKTVTALLGGGTRRKLTRENVLARPSKIWWTTPQTPRDGATVVEIGKFACYMTLS
ncbi:hypothetical protein BJV78DRAFT_722973 [Lactifluus subvellereus]|nr:hypothetical protein BJV78DRAFT_722973 [Lactifluus subvellereus]